MLRWTNQSRIRDPTAPTDVRCWESCRRRASFWTRSVAGSASSRRRAASLTVLTVRAQAASLPLPLPNLPQWPQQQEQPSSSDSPASNAEAVWERQMVALWRFAQHPAMAHGTQMLRRRAPRAARPPPPPRLVTSAEAYASMASVLSADEDAASAALVPALACPPRSLDPALGWRLHLMAVAEFVADHGRLPGELGLLAYPRSPPVLSGRLSSSPCHCTLRCYRRRAAPWRRRAAPWVERPGRRSGSATPLG